jgi:hypothetical protein
MPLGFYGKTCGRSVPSAMRQATAHASGKERPTNDAKLWCDGVVPKAFRISGTPIGSRGVLTFKRMGDGLPFRGP